MNAQFAGSGVSLILHGLAVLAIFAFNAEIRLPPPPVPMDLAVLHAPEPPAEIPGPPDEPPPAAPPAPAEPEPQVAKPPTPKPVPKAHKKPAPQKKPKERENAPKPEKTAETPSAPPTQAAAAVVPTTATAPATGAGLPGSAGRGGSRGLRGGPYSQGEIDGKLVALKRAPPEYPASARRRNIEGWVRVQFIVNTHGQPERIRILAADPRDVFEANAERAVSGWRFRPGTVDGRVVQVLVEQTIRFRLR